MMNELDPHPSPCVLHSGDVWTVWRYRSIVVHSCDGTNLLLMPGHPPDGKLYQYRETLFRIIDRWLDHRDLPLQFLLLLPVLPQERVPHSTSRTIAYT
jgi:hypothetical protein